MSKASETCSEFGFRIIARLDKMMADMGQQYRAATIYCDSDAMRTLQTAMSSLNSAKEVIHDEIYKRWNEVERAGPEGDGGRTPDVLGEHGGGSDDHGCDPPVR